MSSHLRGEDAESVADVEYQIVSGMGLNSAFVKHVDSPATLLVNIIQQQGCLPWKNLLHLYLRNSVSVTATKLIIPTRASRFACLRATLQLQYEVYGV
jgi:hypothetical protein